MPGSCIFPACNEQGALKVQDATERKKPIQGRLAHQTRKSTWMLKPGCNLAGKMLLRSHRKTKSGRSHVEHEAAFIRALAHDNIVRLVVVCRSCTVMICVYVLGRSRS